MWRRRVQALSCALVVAAAACGGKSNDDEHPGSGGASGSGGDTAPSGGAGPVGGSSGSGGAISSGGSGGSAAGGTCQPSSSFGGCDADVPPVSCVPDCGREVNHVASLECSGAGWQCPAGMVRWDCCPAGSCAFRDYLCCNRYTGHQERPICGDDGQLKGCAADSTPSDDVCIPDDLDVTNDCTVLDERACTQLGQRCSTRPWYCECEARETGQFWECRGLLI